MKHSANQQESRDYHTEEPQN